MLTTVQFHTSPSDTIKSMKKLFIYCTISLLAALVACNREPFVPETEDGNPLVDTVGERHVSTGFYASVPGAAVKTSVDMATGVITWQTDDPIMVSDGTNQMTMYVEEGGTTYAALYSTEEVLEGSDFYAVYPAQDAFYSDGVFQTKIPSVQSFKRGGFREGTFPMVAICDGKRHFAFRNAASLLRIDTSAELFEGCSITSLTLTADEPLAGTIGVNYTAGKEPVVECMEGESRITVVPDEENIPLGEPIYVVVVPGDYTNLTVSMMLSNGVGYSCPVEGSVSVNRSAYKKLSVSVKNDFTDLSSPETANCYTITKPGRYKFRADIKGNGVETSCGIPAVTGGINSARIYHSDGSNFIVGGIGYYDNYMYFSTVDGAFLSGTALVSALSAEGTTLWSWHIWANSEIKDVELSDGTSWLNMNLGAHQEGFNSAGFNGYYYQWGRKDPFLQKYTSGTSVAELAPFVSHASKTDGSLENSIANPHIFYGGYRPSGKSSQENTEDWSTYEDSDRVYDWWNKNITSDNELKTEACKTMFDPCPPGYHVPVYGDLESLLALTKASSTAEDGGRKVEGKLFFPYTSYRYISLYLNWWPGGNEASRIFIPSATPSETTTKHHRRFQRLYMTSSPSEGFGNGVRSYGVPVRCIKDGTSVPLTVAVTGVTLTPDVLTLVEGGSYALTATVLPDDATDKSVTWSSSSESVATVSDGLVRAVSPGTATITVNASGFTATCLVTVKEAGGSFGGDIEDMDPDQW